MNDKFIEFMNQYNHLYPVIMHGESDLMRLKRISFSRSSAER